MHDHNGAHTRVRHRALIQESPLGVLIEDNAGLVLEVNEKLCEMFGIEEPPEALIGADCPEVRERFKHLFADPEGFVERIEEILEEKHLVSGEELRLADGRIFERDYVPVFADGEYRGHLWHYRDITGRGRMEKVPREGGELYRVLMEQSVEAIYVYDAETRRVLESNPAFQELIGYTAGELAGMEIYEFIAHEREDIDAHIRLSLREGKRHIGRRDYRRKDGSMVVVETSASVVPYRGKTALCAVSRDVTGRKEAEEAIRKSEERFRQLFDQSVDTLLVHDEEGRIFDCNAEACRSLGYTREELLRLNVRDLTDELLTEEERRERERTGGTLWQRIAAGEEVTPAAIHFGNHKCKDGSTFPIEVRVGGVDYGGKRMILASARDVTEQKQAEEALRESEERFRSLVRNAPDAISLLEADSTILYDSPAIERLLGYQPEERVGARGFEYVHPEDLEKARRTFVETLETPGVGRPTEYRLRHKDGSWRHFEATRTNLLDDPAVGAVVLNYRDVTERKRAEEKLWRQNEYLSALHETSLELVDRLELPDLLEAIVARAGALVGTPHGYVFLAEPGETELEMQVGAGVFSKYVGSRMKSGECVPGRVWESGQPVVVDYYPAWEGRLPQFSREAFRTIAGVPLKSGSEVVGVIGFSYLEEGRAFGEDEVELLSRFAAMASVALENARLYAKTKQELAERERAEEALRESEERFRTIFENTALGISIADPERRLLETNSAYQKMTGYSREELFGKLIAEISHPDDVPVDEERNEEVHAGHLDWYQREKRYIRKDGEVIWVQPTISVVRGNEGEPQFLIGTVEDVTERRRAEKKLRESEERYRAVVEQSTEAIWLFDPDTKQVLESNAAFRELLGYTVEDLRGMTNYDFVAHSREDVDAAVERKVRASKESIPAERKYRRRDGAVLDVEVCGTLISYQGKEVVCSVARDLTERKRAEEALQESEERFRSAFENASSGVAMVGLDRRFLRVNPALCKVLGYSKEELLSKKTLEVTHPEDLGKSLRRTERLLESEGADRYSLEKRYIHKDGRAAWAISDVSLVRDPHGAPSHFVTQVHDITARKMAEEALKESERLLKTVTGGASVILFAIDQDGTITLSEGKALESVGEEPGGAVGKSVFEVYGNLPDVLDNVRRALSGEEVAALVKIEDLAFDTRYSPIWDENGEVSGVVGVATDVTERQALEKELEYRAFHDSLTGLPNRALFSDRLEHALARGSRQRESVAALMLDLDNFKHINDSLGHSAGDSLLVEVAERLRAYVRPGDTVSRLGGDEFAILLENTEDRDAVKRVAERIEKGLGKPFSIEGAAHEVWATASIGIAFANSTDETIGNLLRKADVAMYRVKGRGKAAHEVFDPRADTRLVGRPGPAYDLRRAIEREEFTVRYQPVASLEAGRILCMEALVRWEHPERGLLLPKDFVPLAEETGLIVPLDKWVLREACRQGKRWREEHPEIPPLLMSVNLSARHFDRSGLTEEIASVLEEASLEPSSLQLEITESATIEDAFATRGILDRLKALGVRLAVDDFGTGYSSISYLTQFPVDVVKIDRSIVTALGREPRGAAVVSAVIALARSLGETVVAEGVEDAEKLERLRNLGCELGQGEHFWPPLPAAEAFGIYLESLRQTPAWV